MSLEEILKELAVRMYLNGGTDVAASSETGVSPGKLGHAEPIMEMKVEEAKEQIKTLMLEIVGEGVNAINDDSSPKKEGTFNKYLVAENRLRAELRKKVEAL